MFKSIRKRVGFHIRQRRAAWVRANARARFIAVTGSSGKSTTVALMGHILAIDARVKVQLFDNSLKSLVNAMRFDWRLSDFVVVEVGASGKNSIQRHAAFIRPDVALVTMIGLEHVSTFKTADTVAREKGFLVEALGRDGVAVLNADDPRTPELAARTSAKIVTFGFDAGATYRVIKVERCDAEGVAFTLAAPGGRTVALRAPLAGRHFVQMVAGVFACLSEMGIEDERIARGLTTFKNLPRRFEIFRPADGPTFVLDTYKAPLSGLDACFASFGGMSAPRKWIVLGQLSDFSEKPKRVYARAYQMAREVGDIVVFVGEHAHRSGASDADRSEGRFLSFGNPTQARAFLELNARPTDAILLKSSASIDLDRVALDWRSGAASSPVEAALR